MTHSFPTRRASDLKARKTIGVVLGGFALVATGLGALGVPAILGVSTSAIAGIAGLASGLASIGAQALAKPPPARGSITQLIVDPNAPQPSVMGGSHFAGVLRHRAEIGRAHA